jgi:hypothetical protein
MKTPISQPQKQPLARATMRLPESLWIAAQHRAIDQRLAISELVARALRRYLTQTPAEPASMIMTEQNFESIQQSARRGTSRKKGGRS